MRWLLVLLMASTAHADDCKPPYRGKPIDLDVKDADIHEVLRFIADSAHTNLVVPDTVQGRVTLVLKRVPWDQVLCTIAKLHKLSVERDGNVVMLKPR